RLVAARPELAVGAAVVLEQRVGQHGVLVVADLDHLLWASGRVLAEAALTVVDDDAIGGGRPDHGRADLGRDPALVGVLYPEELPFGDRDLAARALHFVLHGARRGSGNSTDVSMRAVASRSRTVRPLHDLKSSCRACSSPSMRTPPTRLGWWASW